MSPSISPPRVGQGDRVYAITDSKAFVAGFNVNLNASNAADPAATFGTEVNASVFYPDNLNFVPEITLIRLAGANPTIIHLLPAGGEAPPAGYLLNIEPPQPAQNNRLQLSVTFAHDGGVNDDPWELRVTGPSAITWQFTVSNQNDAVITWLASDPVAHLSVPSEVLERDANVKLTADDATSPTTLVGQPPVPLFPTYTWLHATGAVPLTDLPQTTSEDNFTIQTPVVYQREPMQLRVRTALTDNGAQQPSYDGFLTNLSAPTSTAVLPRPQQLVIVLDRSGSMVDENRYENAKTACRALVHLFAGLREGVNPADGIAIVAFEDEKAGFRGGAPSSRIQTLLPAPATNPTSPLASLTDALEAIEDLDFGVPGTNTPIGDGLVFAVDLLAQAGPVGNRKFTIVVCTDGLENAGTVTIGDQNVGDAITFAEATGSGVRNQVVNATSLFAIALGPSADQELLNRFASTIGGGSSKLVTDPAALAAAFADDLQPSLKVNQLTPAANPGPNQADRDFPPDSGKAVYFSTDSGVDRLAVEVVPPDDLTPFDPSDNIQLARLIGDTYVAEPTAKLYRTESERGASVSIPGLQNTVPGQSIPWRVIKGDGPTTADTIQPRQVLPYVDLHLLADVVLDKPAYGTGDAMTLTVRIRNDAAPVLGATVQAVLIAPDAGLGEELSLLGAVPTDPQAAPRHDELPWLERRVGMVLARRKWPHLPVSQPTGVFVDGTNQLFDPDGDGNYTNTFVRTFKEGTYTWQLTVEGLDANGGPFTRSLSIATFVSVKVDPRATKVKVTEVRHHPSGLQAASVVITPQDKRHERLGPGKDDVVFWALRNGTFEHIFQNQPTPVFTDGTYRRVVLFQKHQHPSLRVKAAGVLLPEIDVRRALLGHDY